MLQMLQQLMGLMNGGAGSRNFGGQVTEEEARRRAMMNGGLSGSATGGAGSNYGGGTVTEMSGAGGGLEQVAPDQGLWGRPGMSPAFMQSMNPAIAALLGGSGRAGGGMMQRQSRQGMMTRQGGDRMGALMALLGRAQGR